MLLLGVGSLPAPLLPGTYLPRRAGGWAWGRREGQEHPCLAPAWHGRGGPSGREGREKCEPSRPS